MCLPIWRCLKLNIIKKLWNNSLVTGAAVYLLSNVVSAATPLLLLPILTRELSPGEYGKVAIFLSVTVALNAIVGLNTIGSISRKYFDPDMDNARMGGYIASCIHIVAATVIALLLILLFIDVPLAHWLSVDRAWMYWAVFVSACSVLISIRLGQWQVRGQPGKYALMQISQSVMLFTLTIVFVLLLKQQAAGRVFAHIVAVGLVALVAMFFLVDDGLLKFGEHRKQDYRESLAFGVPLIPHSIGIFLLSAADRVVINDRAGLAQAGIFMVAAQLAGALGLLFDAINNAFVPWLYARLKSDDIAARRMIVRRTYKWFGVLLAMAALSFAAGPVVTRLMVSDKYHEAATLVGWLVLGQCFNGMYLMVTNYVFYSKRTGMLAVGTIVSGLASIALMIGLLPILGLKGAAIAFAAGMLARFLITWRVAQLRFPMPWFSAP